MRITRSLPRLFLLLCLLLAGAAAPGAPLLPGSSQTTASPASDPQQLRAALDELIRTLEDDGQRRALLQQLKSLRQGTDQLAGASDSPERHGMLGALATLFEDSPAAASEKEPTLLATWATHGRAALADARVLLAANAPLQWSRGLLAAVVGLAVWLGLLYTLAALGATLFRHQGWPLVLPEGSRPWWLLAHFLRRVLPGLLAFLLMLFLLDLHSLPLSGGARALVLIVAYATLCGRALMAAAEVAATLFAHGHRRVAAHIVHRDALRPLFVIGALVALSDALLSDRMAALLGDALCHWLAVSANIVNALLSGWLVLRLRRPVAHLIGNRPYAQRHAQGTGRALISLLARLWYIPALLLVGSPLVAIIVTGGEAGGALPRAIACAALLAGTLMITGVLRRHSERIPGERRQNEYRLRLARFGYTLTHCALWLLFVELSLRVWGLSLLSLSQHSVIGAFIGNALLGLGVTVLLAWLVWLLADTAIQRALNRTRGGAQAHARAQTITPMIRNVVFFTILLIAAIVGLANMGVNVTPLLAGAGVIGLAVGFGAQTLVQDLITGIFILVEDSLAVGDFVEIAGHMGTVEGLNLRTVRLRDLDGVLHIITFSHIPSIHNMSRQFGIALMKIRIPHELPIDDAITLMKETADELRRDPAIGFRVWSPLEMQGIHSFEEGCAVLRMRLRTAPEYQWDVSRAFNLLLKRRMEAHNVQPGAARLSLSMEAQGGGHYDGKGHPVTSDSR